MPSAGMSSVVVTNGDKELGETTVIMNLIGRIEHDLFGEIFP